MREYGRVVKPWDRGRLQTDCGVNIADSTTWGNSTVETSYDLVHRIEPGAIVEGTRIGIVASGSLNTTFSGTPTFTLKGYLNDLSGDTNVIAQTSAVTLTGGLTAAQWMLNLIAVCRKGGANGTMDTSIVYAHVNKTQFAAAARNKTGVNLTAPLDLVISAKWSIANAQNVSLMDLLAVTIDRDNELIPIIQ